MNKLPDISKRKLRAISAITMLTVVFIWWMLTSVTKAVKPLWFPTIESVVQTAVIMKEQLLFHALATLARVVSSWLIGSVIGVIVGLVIFSSKTLHSILNPLIETLRPVPPVALIPLVLVWFGIGDSGKIFITALACMMIMVVNTYVACGNVAPVYVQAAQSMGASKRSIYLKVFLPAIIPEIMSGARISIASAFGVVVACEYMGAKYGVGYLIMQASRTLKTSTVILGTIVIGVEAFLLEGILHKISKVNTKWKE